MRIKLYFSIVCLFISFSSTDNFNKLTFSLWSKPDIEIFYSLPEEVNEDTKVLLLFMAHQGQPSHILQNGMNIRIIKILF